jgi:16S rRNA (cytosine967-C5)-methyltransferase
MPAPLTARAAALRLLTEVIGQGRLMSELTEVTASLSAPDRARTQRLATETLRNLDRADRVLARHMTKAPPLRIRTILRMATFELCTGGDAHGVVNEAVSLAAADRKSGHLKGLVNAVLRKVAADGVALWATLPPPRLPRWLREPLVQAWGKQAVAGMERAHAARPPVDLTCRTDAASWAERAGGALLPTGSVRLVDPGQISGLPGYDEGAWWVQDAAAALPARLIDAKPGERVLDLCAAPGGKTLQLAAAGAEVTALDLSERRLDRLRQNLTRTGLAARVEVGDALEFAESGWDAILLDAPCSATGTIRRHPDLPQAKDGAEFVGLIELQARMLDHAIGLLRPGGRLVFCTCSLLPDEGEVQVEEALSRHPGLVADPAALALPGIDPAWTTEEGGLRLRPDFWPDAGGMDGFYMAVLRRA